jgi:hypothetical protein
MQVQVGVIMCGGFWGQLIVRQSVKGGLSR